MTRSTKARARAAKPPTSQGYDPTEPWYYVTGGTPLDPDEIGKNAEPFSLNGEQPTWEHLDGIRLSLAKAVERYKELVEKGDAALSEWTRRMDEHRDGPYREIHGALASAHNAILYDRKRLAAVQKALAGKGRPVALFTGLDEATTERRRRGRAAAKS